MHSARNGTPVPAIRSSIASDPVTRPASPATGVPRPSAEMLTTRPTAWVLNASAAGRLKSTYAAKTLSAFGSAGTSQNTASAPANASATTDGSLCEPRMISTRSATSGASRAGSRATTRTATPSMSRFCTTWRPIPLVGAVITIMGLS